jgi:tRNA (guanine37-N1)-methyltransferase
MLWVGIISIFPDMFQALHNGIIGKAIKNQLVTINLWNPRDFVSNKHKSVDDRPYGGGSGMVMTPKPLQAAIHAAKQAAPEKPTVIYLSPQGRHYDQEAAVNLATKKAIILLAGRYEGIDERIITYEVDEEWSVGDYILTGGELAAMVMLDAAIRLLPGAVGDEESIKQDSLTSGLLKYPQYTRPENFQGIKVPRVLLSGCHQLIHRWRLQQALGKTWLRRPDLLAKKKLDVQEMGLLSKFITRFLHKP